MQIMTLLPLQYLSPLTEVVAESPLLVYKVVNNGERQYAVAPINLVNYTKLTVIFIGRANFKWNNDMNPGIALYDKKLNLEQNDQDNQIYGILLSWDGKLWVRTPTKIWYVISPIPRFTEGIYTVRFSKSQEGKVKIDSVSINGEQPNIINFTSEMSWDDVGYISIRTDHQGTEIYALGLYAQLE